MPAKKSVSKKVSPKTPAKGTSTSPKRAPSTVPSLAGMPYPRPCDLPHVCEYLKDLDAWLQNFFIKDYKRLRIAVCNVERQAFGGTGNANTPPRFCHGGTGNEPADPTPPPKW